MATLQQTNPTRLQFRRGGRGCSDGGDCSCRRGRREFGLLGPHGWMPERSEEERKRDERKWAGEAAHRSATLPIPHYSTPLPTPQTTLHATSLLITTPSSSPPSSNQPPSGHLTSRTFKLTQHHDAALRPRQDSSSHACVLPNALTDCATEATPHLLSSSRALPLIPPHPPHPSTHLLPPILGQPRIHLPFPTQLHLYRVGAATPPLLSNLQSLPTSNFSQIQPRRIASHRIASHRINRSATLPIPPLLYSITHTTNNAACHFTPDNNTIIITTILQPPPSGHLTSRTFKLTQHHDAALRPEAGLDSHACVLVVVKMRDAIAPGPLPTSSRLLEPFLSSTSSTSIHPRTYSSHPRFSRAFTYHSPPNSTSTEEELPHHHSSLTSNPSQPPTSHKYNHVASHRIASHRIASVAHITMATQQQTNPTRLQFRRGGRGCSDGGDNRSATLPIPHYSTPLPTPQTTLHATSLLITTPSSSPPSSNQPPSGHLTSRTFKLTQHHDAALRPEAGLELTRVRVAERANRLRHGGHSPPPLVFSSPSSHPPHPPHPSRTYSSILGSAAHSPTIPPQLHLYRTARPRYRTPHYSTPLPTPQTTLHATSLLITTPSSSPPSSNQPPSGHLTSRTFKLTQHHDAALRPEAGLELTRVRVGGGQMPERANRLRHGGHSSPPLVFSSPSSHPPHPPHPSTHLLLPSSVQPLIHLPFPTQLHLYRVGAATTTSSLTSNPSQPPTSHKYNHVASHRGIASHRIALSCPHHNGHSTTKQTTRLQIRRGGRGCSDGGDCSCRRGRREFGLLGQHAWIEAERSEERRGREMRGNGHGEAAHRSATLPIPHYSTPLPTPQTTLHATSLLITTPSSSPPSSNQPPSGHLTSRTFKLTQHHDAALRPEAGLELTRVRVGGGQNAPLLTSSRLLEPFLSSTSSTSSIHAPTPPILGSAAHSPTIPTQLHLYRVGAATPPLLSNLQSPPNLQLLTNTTTSHRIASHRIASHQLAHITMATLQQTNPTRLQFRRGGRGCSEGGKTGGEELGRQYHEHHHHYHGWRKGPLAAVGFEPTPFRTGALNRRLRPLGHATDTPLLYSITHTTTTLHATSLLITTPSSSPPSSNQPPSGHLTSRTFKLTQHHDAALRPEAGLELTRVRVVVVKMPERANRLRHGGHSSPPLVFSSPSSHPPHPPHPSTHLLLPSSVQPLIHLPFPTQLHLYRVGAATPPLLSNLPIPPNLQLLTNTTTSHRIASHRIASVAHITMATLQQTNPTRLQFRRGGRGCSDGDRPATLPIPHYSTPLPTPQTTLHATSLLITTPSSSPPSSNQPPSGHLTSRTFKLTQHHDAALRPEAGLELTRPNALTDCATEGTPHLLSSSRALPLIHLIHLIHPRTYSSHLGSAAHSPTIPTQLHLYRGGAATPPLLSNLQSLPTSNFSQIQPRRIGIASHRIASVAHITMATLQQQTQLVCNSGGEDVDAAMAVIVVAEEEGGSLDCLATCMD
ncbi:hypothetical protein Aperf_G00000030803 [Anoplocephala perfoliata]